MKTKTLFNDANQPCVSILPGHVHVEIFDQAFQAEGITKVDPWEAVADVKYEYWIEYKPQHWKKSDKQNSDAQPVTVGYW